MKTRYTSLLLACVGTLTWVTASQAEIKSSSTSPLSSSTSKQEVQKTYDDIQRTLGLVPEFLKAFPESGITGAWQEMKNFQMSSNTAISPKNKELIGLAVAAQVPCEYCVYFHTRAAKMNGASDQEVKESIAMASLTRKWSTVLNGSAIDKTRFKVETDQIMEHSRSKSRQQMGGKVDSSKLESSDENS